MACSLTRLAAEEFQERTWKVPADLPRLLEKLVVLDSDAEDPADPFGPDGFGAREPWTIPFYPRDALWDLGAESHGGVQMLVLTGDEGPSPIERRWRVDPSLVAYLEKVGGEARSQSTKGQPPLVTGLEEAGIEIYSTTEVSYDAEKHEFTMKNSEQQLDLLEFVLRSCALAVSRERALKE